MFQNIFRKVCCQSLLRSAYLRHVRTLIVPLWNFGHPLYINEETCKIVSKSGHEIAYTTPSGVNRFKLKKVGIDKSFKQSECVWSHFNQSVFPFHLKLMFRDGNALNDHISNLCTCVKSCCIDQRTGSILEQWPVTDISDYVSIYTYPDILINADAGHVIFKSDHMFHYRLWYGYILINVKKPFRLARFIFQHVNGKIPDGYQIDHISGNKWDNSIHNLQMLTAKEHAQKTYSTNLRWNLPSDAIAVIGMNSKTDEEYEYKSMTNAGNDLLCSVRSISRAIAGEQQTVFSNKYQEKICFRIRNNEI